VLAQSNSFVELLFSLNLCCHYQKKPLAQQLRPAVSTNNEIVIQSLPRRIKSLELAIKIFYKSQPSKVRFQFLYLFLPLLPDINAILTLFNEVTWSVLIIEALLEFGSHASLRGACDSLLFHILLF